MAGDLGEERILGYDRGLKCVLDPSKIGLQNGQLEKG
jgi:hypothetical protein